MKTLDDYITNALILRDLERLDYLVENNAQTEASFGELPPYEQKRFLCNALGVPLYTSNEILREKLESIINAI